MSTIKFTIDYNGKTYNCESEIEGKRVFYQTVNVIGVGYKKDERRYDLSDIHTAQAVAKILAKEIILSSINSE